MNQTRPICSPALKDNASTLVVDNSLRWTSKLSDRPLFKISFSCKKRNRSLDGVSSGVCGVIGRMPEVMIIQRLFFSRSSLGITYSPLLHIFPYREYSGRKKKNPGFPRRYNVDFIINAGCQIVWSILTPLARARSRQTDDDDGDLKSIEILQTSQFLKIFILIH